MFTLVGAHNYFKAQGEIITRMNEQVEMAKLRASTVLPSLIWNFSTDSIIDFSKAELRSEFISGVIVSDDNESLFSGVKNSNNEMVLDAFDKFAEDERQISFELVHIENDDHSKVGHVSIRYNEQYLEQRLQQILWQQVTQSMAYCFVLFILIWALINRLVLDPLLNLNQRLNTITREIAQR